MSFQGPRFALTTLASTFGGAFLFGLLGPLAYFRRMRRVEYLSPSVFLT